jgi:cholesterol transport system auxiliary component
MTKRARLLLPLVAMLAGCAGSLLESTQQAPEMYRLAGATLSDQGGRLPLALGVAQPRAAVALDTERVAVVQPDNRFDYFAGVRWTEPAPQMLQQQLVRAFAADGRFEAVLAAPSRVPADLLLDVELRRFEAVYAAGDSAPEVQVEMQVSLVDPRKGLRVDSFVVTASAVAGQDRRAAVIAAFEQATAEVVQTTVSRVRESTAPR